MAAKLVAFSQAAREKVLRGINVLADAVTDLHVQRHELAVFQALALADSDHFAFLGLLSGGVRNMQATLHTFCLFNPFDHEPVIERSNIHNLISTFLSS